MSFATMISKTRKDPLGPLSLGTLQANVAYLRRLVGLEHIYSGEHNAFQVPRRCSTITGTTVSPSTLDIASVTNPATGKYVLTLASSRFDQQMVCQLNSRGADGTKPYLLGMKQVSATSLEIYQQKLSSALGAGNVWAPANASFDIAIHAQPLDGGTFNDLPEARARGDYLDDGLVNTTTVQATWNNLVQEEAELYRILTSAHTSAGVHNVRETAYQAGLVRYNSGSGLYGKDTSMPNDFSTYSRSSAGVVTVTYSGTLTTPVSAFASQDYLRISGGSPSDLYIYNVVPGASSAVVYIFKYDTVGKTWSAADADFFLAVHGS